MKKSWLGIAALAATLALSACVSIKNAPPGPYAAGKGYTVTLGRQWSDITAIMLYQAKGVHLLSIDGPLLNRLYITDGIAPGGFMLKPEAKEQPTPTFRAGMAPNELVEFVADSVTALGYQRVETVNPRPARFGDGVAIRFDLTAKTKEGLDMSGTALVAERGGKAYVILYVAPTEHYYAENLAEVEKVMGSVAVN